MTHDEWAAWATSAAALAVGIWNRFGIKDLSLHVDGLLVKYVKGEKTISYAKGKSDEQGEQARRDADK